VEWIAARCALVGSVSCLCGLRTVLLDLITYPVSSPLHLLTFLETNVLHSGITPTFGTSLTSLFPRRALTIEMEMFTTSSGC
jgi:hypothetical protein